MAMSAIERKRKQLERERQELRVLPDSTYSFLRTPFYRWLQEHESGDWSGVWFALNAAGFDLPAFEDDSGPRSLDGEVERMKTDEDDYDPYAGYAGSIGRAEAIVDYLLSAVEQFALVVNQYKIEEIDERIAELESADLSDPAAKKQALADMVRLAKMREQLSKQMRRSFYAWKVKGI